MASQYTTNNRIEKIGTGEQAGTWGSTTNTNFDIIDRAINGVGTISLSGTADDLTTSDGLATSNGLFKVLKLTGSLSSSFKLRIRPNNVQKLYFIVNSSGQAVEIGQIDNNSNFDVNSNSVSVANGKTAIVYADGGGSTNAKVRSIETGSDEFTEDVSIKTSDGALLTLETSDTEITDGDVLGVLQFRAPDESDGNPQNIVTSAIETKAVGAFTGSANKTKLSFKTADGAGALERVKIESADATTKASKIIITSGNDTVAQDQVFGRLSYQAPLEAGGGYGVLETAMIDAVAEEAYDATANNTSLIFKTSLKSANSGVPQEKFRIASNGECGIYADGSTSSNNLRVGLHGDLKIYHDATDSFVSNAGGHLFIRTTNSDKQVALQQDSLTKLHTTTSGVQVNGTIIASGDITAFSDERLKSDIETIDNALDKVMNMRGVSFTKQAEKGVGVIAQEIEKVLPEVVTDGEYKSVAYGNIVGVLIEAIKEQQKQIDELKKGK